MLTKEVMSTRIEGVSPTTSVQECARKMDRSGVGVLPVWEDGQTIGVVTDRDICGKDPAKTLAQEIMTTTVTSCSEDQDCAHAASLMKDQRVRLLAVRGKSQAMVGLLSVDDLARCSHDMAGEVLDAVASWPH